MTDINTLLDPKLGVLRGIMIDVEPGKGGPDADDKIIGMRVDELRKIYDTLAVAKQLVSESRDSVMGFIGSSYAETGKEDEAFVDELGAFLGEKPIDWRFFNS